MSATEARTGLLVVLSGPSGVGKTTVADRLLRDPGVERAVTATTRTPRDGERSGEDYVFLDREAFLAGVARGEFLEHAVVHGRLYGTPRRNVEEILARGEVCLLNIDVQGAAQVRGRIEPALFVFLRAPSEEELARRLRGRGTESDEQIAARIETARAELAREDEYDVTVVNDDLERAVAEVRARIEEQRKSGED